jgi:alpha-L-arabinofuranosidase
MMAENRPDFLFNTLSTDSVKNLFCISGYDKTTDEIIIKVVNTSAQPQKAAFHFKGIRFPGPTVTTITLTHTDCTAENSLYNPHVVIPQKSQISKGKEDIEKEFAPWSFTILRVKTSELKIDKPTIK